MSNSTSYNAADWDSVRTSFATSLMVGVKLNALAENIGENWPYAGADETPSKYIDLTWDELQEHPTFLNRPERIQMLIDILKETLAFDNPLGDMVEQTDEKAAKENEMERTLEKLSIPLTFPINLSNLEAETKEFCEREKLVGIGEFVSFCQRMAKNIVIGGDYRSFLNALATVDEAGISKYIPFRKGSKGLHLPEAAALAVATRSKAEQASLLKRYGGRMSAEEQRIATLSAEAVNRAEEAILKRIDLYIGHFKDQAKALTAKLETGETLDRDFMAIGNPSLEFVASALLKKALNPNTKSESKGIFGIFSKLFKK